MFANFCLFSRRARRSLYHFFCIAFVSSRLHACTQRHTNPRSSHRHYHYHFASPARWCRCRRGPLGVVDTCLFAWRRCRTRRWAARISPRGCTCGPEARGAPCRVSYWRIRRVNRCRTDNRRRSGRNDDSSTRWTLRDMCSCKVPSKCISPLFIRLVWVTVWGSYYLGLSCCKLLRLNWARGLINLCANFISSSSRHAHSVWLWKARRSTACDWLNVVLWKETFKILMAFSRGTYIYVEG